MTVKSLAQEGISSTLVMDSSIAYIVDKIDMFIVGSEGVVENGGLINQVTDNIYFYY